MEGTKRIYANVFEMAASPYDFMLRFIWRAQGNNQQEFLDEEQVRVFMSPEHVKSVLQVLTTAVEDWERQFGTIPSPAIHRKGISKGN